MIWAANRVNVKFISSEAKVLERGLLSIGLSLMAAFLLSQIFFYLDLSTQFEKLVLYFVIVATSLTFVVRGNKFEGKIDLVGFSLLILSAAILFFLITNVNAYSLIFTQHDAVVSYNRWGIELYFNEYYPTISAYPLLFPTLWSLIYKIQGDYSLQITSKLTLFIIPILLLLICTVILKTKPMAALFTLGLAGPLLLQSLSQMVSGMMDVPVASFGLVGLAAIVCESVRRADGAEPNFSYFVISALFVGLAGAVKQPGWAYIFIALIIFSSDKEITSEKPKRILWLGTLLFLPSILNFVMFAKGGVPLLSGYQTISTLNDINHLDPSVQLTYALKIMDGHGISLVGLTCFIVSNAFFIKTRPGQLGLFLAGSAYVGFIGYLDCCAYSARNSYWIVPLLVLSAFLGAYNLFAKIKLENTNFSPPELPVLFRFDSTVFYFAVTVSVIVAFVFPKDSLLKHQKDIEYKTSSFMRVIKGNENLLTANNIVLTSHQRIAYKVGNLDKFGIGKVSSGYKGKGRGFFDICTGTRFRSFPHKVYSVDEILECKNRVFIVDVTSKFRKYNLEHYRFEVISESEGVTFAEILRF